jgi:hypothetical protein
MKKIMNKLVNTNKNIVNYYENVMAMYNFGRVNCA